MFRKIVFSSSGKQSRLIVRDMTAEEVAELEKLAAEMAAMPAPEPTVEERIAALEKDNAELRDALDALITGVTA